ncbi:MAG: hypothetical protein M3Z01_03110 [Thermoproteota archaeon]|nr:hypothetical protein [Thermoproteota archaeon]
MFLLLSGNIFSQGSKAPTHSSYLGAGAYSINHVDAFSFTSNQAALAQIKNAAVGVYGEKRYLLSSTNLYAAVIVIPTKQGNFGLQVDYFGFKNYNESQIGIAYARNLGSKLDVGIKFNYYGFRIPAYGNQSSINFEIGAIAHLTEKLHVGIHAYNPAGNYLSKTNSEKLSSIYKFGIGYEASEKFIVSTEIIKQEDQPVNVNISFQYNFMKQFFVRAGTTTETTNSYLGAGISWKIFRLDISGSYHPQLGFTPGLLLIIHLNKTAE